MCLLAVPTIHVEMKAVPERKRNNTEPSSDNNSEPDTNSELDFTRDIELGIDEEDSGARKISVVSTTLSDKRLLSHTHT